MNNSTETSRNVQHNNAQNAVLFEAIALAIHLDTNSPLVTNATVLLARFISSKETNVRYLGLDTMAHLAGRTDSLDPIKKHQSTIILSLRDKDISVRRRALDLLFSMCDVDNSELHSWGIATVSQGRRLRSSRGNGTQDRYSDGEVCIFIQVVCRYHLGVDRCCRRPRWRGSLVPSNPNRDEYGRPTSLRCEGYTGVSENSNGAREFGKDRRWACPGDPLVDCTDFYSQATYLENTVTSSQMSGVPAPSNNSKFFTPNPNSA
jgi:hypothetical protein